jgi:hypothetical protein
MLGAAVGTFAQQAREVVREIGAGINDALEGVLRALQGPPPDRPRLGDGSTGD